MNRNKSFKQISIENIETLIKRSQTQNILYYFKTLIKIKRNLKRIRYLYQIKCSYKEFNCRYLPDLKSLFILNTSQIYNPIYLYNLVSNIIKLIKKRDLIDLKCKNCFYKINNLLKTILEVLGSLKIILDYKDFQRTAETSQRFSNFYEELFPKTNYLLEDDIEINRLKNTYRGDLIDTYDIGDQKLFQINIFNITNENEKKYEITSCFKTKIENTYIEKIIIDIENNLDNLKISQIIPLEKLIRTYQEKALNYIESKYHFSFEEKMNISFLTALKKINLIKLFPLLIDDYIEEIFLDSPKEFVYINHQKFGRCRTEVKFNLNELNRLKTFLRIYSGKRLDYVNPSIKLVIKNTYFYCRFSIDVEPIHVHNFALDIRKLNKNILNIQDLLKNYTLNPKMAAFLYFNLLRRKNITVTGETDTGKTTLINALDLLTPKEFRKIYIENIIESLNQTSFSRHQLKYKVDSLEESFNNKFSKHNQIKKLLHRTPDIIYLGEILTKEEAAAMFHCLSAGLRGFQTIHSKNIDSLINRLLYHFGIHPSCLHDLDLIILMKKNRDKRKIISISEINQDFEKSNDFYKNLFNYNPQLNNWCLIMNLYETNTILQLKQYEDINKERFSAFIETYEDIFNYLKNTNKISNFDLIEFFDNVSFYSCLSINELKQFWEQWKKNRRLNL
ncbi:MAG: ATPase, T2SS/T4P/T4SS family [Candidatus Hodarchaeota archaeon]